VSPDRPEQDDFLEDEEQEEYEGQRSIFATGWFRAVLVLLVLAVIAVIAVPLIGGWFEPTPPPKVTTTTKPSEPAPTTVPVPSAPATPPPAQIPTPSASAPAAPAPAPTTPPPAVVAPTPATPPAPTPPPAVTTPARPEMPPAAAPSKAAEKAKAPERTASAAPGKSAAARPAASSGNYWVQVGAFKETRNAEGLARTLRSEGYSVQVARVTREEPLHVVRVGGYPDRAKAAAARAELQGKGHTGFVTSGPAK
jgi:cell division protein FtsN